MRKLAVAITCALALLLSVSIVAQQTSTATQTTTTTTTKKSRKSTANIPGKLDINSASQGELEALPGIGPATSQKIIDNRPYRGKSDLLKKKIVSASEYAKIKNQIVAHQTSATK
jgi:DNA uptake protein ComE-like DNA-binding protein